MMSSTEKAHTPSLSFSNSILRAIEHLKLTPISTFALVFAFNVITLIGLALYFDAWGPVNLKGGIVSPGLSHEPGAWVIFALAQPMVFAMAVWLHTAADKMITDLAKRQILQVSDDVHAALADGRKKLHSDLLYRSAWIIGFLIQSFVVLLQKGVVGNPNPTWINVHPLVFWSRSVVAVFAYYMLAVVVFSLAIILMTLNRIMKTPNVIRVKVFHPDGAGGLGAIGQFVANLGYLTFTFGMVIVVLFEQARIVSDYGNTGWLIASLISLGVYLIATPLFFFWPLYSTHRAMVRYKEELLREISGTINKLYHSTLDVGAGDISKDSLNRIKQLNELREYTMEFPTWPFNIANLRKYYSLAVSPIVTFLTGLAFEWVQGKLLGT